MMQYINKASDLLKKQEEIVKYIRSIIFTENIKDISILQDHTLPLIISQKELSEGNVSIYIIFDNIVQSWLENPCFIILDKGRVIFMPEERFEKYIEAAEEKAKKVLCDSRAIIFDIINNNTFKNNSYKKVYENDRFIVYRMSK
jgi:hypothetical protein